MDGWLSLLLMHTVLLIVSLVGSCHSGMYDQAMSYSTAYGVPMMYTYPYSGAYYGQRIIPMNPMPHMYGGANYPLIRTAGLYLKPYPGYGYSRRTSSMEDDVNSGDDHHQLQTTNEPYKISLMTDNVQQMMNNGQKEVLSMMSTGGEDGSRLARILVKRRRAAQDGNTNAGAEAAPDMLSRGLETLSSWYRDTNPTSAASSTYYPSSSTTGSVSSTGAAPDMWSRGLETLSSWYRDTNPTSAATPTYYPQSSVAQSSLYPSISSAPSPYVQPMSYNPSPTAMMNINPTTGGGWPNSPAYGYNTNNMNYPPSYYSPPQYSSSKQSAPSFMDTVITALPEITKITTAVAPLVMGRSGRAASQDTDHMLAASNPIVSPYITKKEHLQQKQTDTSSDDKSRIVQQRYAFSDMPYNTMSYYVTDGDSSDQTARTSWSPYQSVYNRVDGDTHKAFDYPYAYRVYVADSTKAADDSSNLRMYKDSDLDFNDSSYNYGDDNTMTYGNGEDQNRLYSGYYSLR